MKPQPEPMMALACLMGAGLVWGASIVCHQRGEGSQGRDSSASPQNASSQNDNPHSNLKFKKVRMKVTAYCVCRKCCGKYADGRTSIGDDARVCDGVAADPRLLPYRTKLKIPGLGIKEVDDTGGAMRRSAKKGITHIDVRMPSHEAALQWGVRWLDVALVGREY